MALADNVTLIAGADTNGKITRPDLALIETPASTATHQVIPHIEIVQRLEEALRFRHISISAEEFAVTKDGKNFFGVMTLDQGFGGANFALGLRNSHSKQFRLSVVVGLRIMVCSNLCFSGDFDIVLSKHTRNFNLLSAISVGLDQAQRRFQPMQQRVEAWQATQITDDQARLNIFHAFIEGALEAPKTLAKAVWNNWLNPSHDEFRERTRYSLQNAYTSAFHQLDPVPLYRATASLGQMFA